MTRICTYCLSNLSDEILIRIHILVRWKIVKTMESITNCLIQAHCLWFKHIQLLLNNNSPILWCSRFNVSYSDVNIVLIIITVAVTIIFSLSHFLHQKNHHKNHHFNIWDWKGNCFAFFELLLKEKVIVLLPISTHLQLWRFTWQKDNDVK